MLSICENCNFLKICIEPWGEEQAGVPGPDEAAAGGAEEECWYQAGGVCHLCQRFLSFKLHCTIAMNRNVALESPFVPWIIYMSPDLQKLICQRFIISTLFVSHVEMCRSINLRYFFLCLCEAQLPGFLKLYSQSSRKVFKIRSPFKYCLKTYFQATSTLKEKYILLLPYIFF
jgi:hypothetical protein